MVGSALLLAIFGLAMTASLGATPPLSYGVWVLMTDAGVMVMSDLSCLTLDTVVARFRKRHAGSVDPGAATGAVVQR